MTVFYGQNQFSVNKTTLDQIVAPSIARLRVPKSRGGIKVAEWRHEMYLLWHGRQTNFDYIANRDGKEIANVIVSLKQCASFFGNFLELNEFQLLWLFFCGDDHLMNESHVILKRSSSLHLNKSMGI